MGSPVEVIPGWSAVNERLECTLVQLNRLMHYYADETPPGDTKDPDPHGKKPCILGLECLDTNMQDILREAQTRLRDFTETMGRLTGRPDSPTKQLWLENEESDRSLADAIHQVSFLKNELAQARHEANSLHKRVRDYEDDMQVRDQSGSCLKIVSELERTKAKLKDKTKEFQLSNFLKDKALMELKESEVVRQREATLRQQEAGKDKLQKQNEMRDLKDNFQRELREVLATTEHQMDREIELQNICQREKDAHFKTIEDMMALHQGKVQNLKAYHAEKLQECCQNHASLESEWQDKEFELQKQINAAVQEKSNSVQQYFDEYVKGQNLDVKFAGLQTDLANEKLAKSQVESELKFARVDLSLMSEKMNMGLKIQDQLQIKIASLQDEMMNLKYTHTAELAKVEEKAFAIQKNLSDVTSTCVHNEHDLYTQKIKTEGLQQTLNSKQKDLLAATTEIQNLRQEVKFLKSEIKSKEEEKRAIQKNYETQCQQLQTTVFKLEMEEKQKCNDIIVKTKDKMEIELQRQAQHHKENIQKLQKQMRMQWDELTKQVGPKFRPQREGTCKT